MRKRIQATQPSPSPKAPPDRMTVQQPGSLLNRVVIIRHWPENEKVWVTILHPADRHELSVPRSYLREVTEEDLKRAKRRRIGEVAPKVAKTPSKKQVLGAKGIDSCWELVKDKMGDPKKYQALRDKYRDKDEISQRKVIRRQLRLLKVEK